jgi:ATP-dependent DNA helicase RecG
MNLLQLKAPSIVENENSVTVFIHHESLGSPEELVMKYIEIHDAITNSIGREITGIKTELTQA